MSEEIKTTVTEEEAMKVLGEFAPLCCCGVSEGIVVGVGVGLAFSALFMFGIAAVDLWKDGRKMKKQIKEFNIFVNEMES